jgi:N-methylhydantoinase B
MNTPIEVTERRFPVRIERYEFITDSGGAGQYRGGLALRRDIRMLADQVSFARYADRHKFAPQGLFGGLPGSVGSFVVNPGSASERTMKSKGLDTLNLGDLLSVCLPGAGGYGDPRQRDRAELQRDLDDEKVSATAALLAYGVTPQQLV